MHSHLEDAQDSPTRMSQYRFEVFSQQFYRTRDGGTWRRGGAGLDYISEIKDKTKVKTKTFSKNLTENQSNLALKGLIRPLRAL